MTDERIDDFDQAELEKQKPGDRWLRWITSSRDASDAELRSRTLELLTPLRDQILDAAKLQTTDTVLDVGTGDGLLGIGALARLGPGGKIIFNDVSKDIIHHLRTVIGTEVHGPEVEYVTSSVTDLAGVRDSSVDVIISRAVLIYVDDLHAAFRSIARVLRPEGQIVIWEPVHSLIGSLDDAPHQFFGWHIPDTAPIATRIKSAYAKPSALSNLTVARMIEAAECAGFENITAEIRVSSRRADNGDDATIKRLLHGQPNPNMPSIAEVMKELLTAPETEEFVAALTQAVRSGTGRHRKSGMLLTATNPRSRHSCISPVQQ
jgi:arsenite methyltransferase